MRTIVTGAAPGADSLAAHHASYLNFQMIQSGADLVIAFPGGRGTADCVRRAVRAGIPVWRIA